MQAADPRAPRGASAIERQARKIALSRYVTFGLATTFLLLGLAGAVVMRIVDEHDFPSFGLATWWVLQTVTTVGYGDVVPTTTAGKVIGGLEMAIGVALISLLTASVTSAVVEHGEAAERTQERLRQDENTAAILEAIAGIDRRLSRIESAPENP